MIDQIRRLTTEPQTHEIAMPVGSVQKEPQRVAPELRQGTEERKATRARGKHHISW
jgi:hypothetical protein